MRIFWIAFLVFSGTASGTVLHEVLFRKWHNPTLRVPWTQVTNLVIRNPIGSIRLTEAENLVAEIGSATRLQNGTTATLRITRTREDVIDVSIIPGPGTNLPLRERSAADGLQISVLSPFHGTMTLERPFRSSAKMETSEVVLTVGIPNEYLGDGAMIASGDVLMTDMPASRYIFSMPTGEGKAVLARLEDAKLLLPTTGVRLVDCKVHLQTVGYEEELKQRFGIELERI